MKISGNRPTGPAGIDAYTQAQRTTGPSASQPAAAPADVSSVLGIPEAEFTPRVRDAIMNLMAEVDRLRQELERTKSRLETVEASADQDPLVPILNRRAFVREMTRIMSFGERYDLIASLIYLDLDGFKAINDANGHAAGDAVLQHVARLIAGHVRESDIVGRLGGDEFGIILAKADKPQATLKARSLAELLSAQPVSWQGKSLKLGCTIGVHTFKKGEDPAAAMAEADKAMYAAKKKSP